MWLKSESIPRMLDDNYVYSERHADIYFSCPFPLDQQSKQGHCIDIEVIRYGHAVGYDRQVFEFENKDVEYDVIFEILKPYILNKEFENSRIRGIGNNKMICTWSFKYENYPEVVDKVVVELQNTIKDFQDNLQSSIPDVVDGLAQLYS